MTAVGRRLTAALAVERYNQVNDSLMNAMNTGATAKLTDAFLVELDRLFALAHDAGYAIRMGLTSGRYQIRPLVECEFEAGTCPWPAARRLHWTEPFYGPTVVPVCEQHVATARGELCGTRS